MRHGPAILALVALSLGFFSMAYGIDPPEKMWEETYPEYYSFYWIGRAEDGGYFLACHPYSYWSEESVCRISDSGEIIWSAGDSGQYWHAAMDIELLQDSCLIVAGVSKPLETGSNGLILYKLSRSGELMWSRLYDYYGYNESGRSVCTLPDGGYAVCGRVYGEGLNEGQAWILRTDENGDTLWTDVWGTHTINFAVGVEYDEENDWIVVLTYGRSDSLINKGPHLLYYTPEGEYLFGTTYPELYPEWAIDLCRFPDGGYGFVSEYGDGYPPTISGTDYLGDLSWFQSIEGFTNGDAHGIDRAVLDDGCMVTGFAQDSISSRSGGALWPQGARLVRFDGRGNEMWDIIEGGFGYQYYAALQLPQGGYVAVGTCYGDGYLVRYAPETGIEGSVSPGGSGLLRPVTPNPSSSVFHVSVDLPEAMDVRLEVYDTAGRRVGLLADDLLPSGEHELTWDASGLSSGCYLVRLSVVGVCETRRCVLLR